MRVPFTGNPFPMIPIPGFTEEYTAYPVRWIWHPEARAGEPTVLVFRLIVDVVTQEEVVCHVSADQRYELYLDGERVGRGPQRGDPQHWFFETYRLSLAAGRHLLAARVWWLPVGAAPMAQMSVHPGFLLHAEGALAELISTGTGDWQVLQVDAYSQEPSRVSGYQVVGWSFCCDGARFPWGWSADPDCAGDWVAAAGDGRPANGLGNRYYDADVGEAPGQHHMLPATLPAMIERTCQIGTVRHAESMPPESRSAQVLAERHDESLASGWQALLAQGESLTIPAHSSARVIVDLDDYYCAYPELETTGGAGAEISIAWAESLFESADPQVQDKGNRDAVQDKHYHGAGDRFIIEGGERRVYDTLWWRSGRYVEICVDAADEALIIERLVWRETRYPLEMESTFACSDEALGDVIPIMHRALQMCAHETYMDCPYYEQLMYVGDTRLEVLVTYLTTFDSRLPQTAISLFDWSRSSDGLTKSRYPSAVPQVIPPFSLWWVGMVYDSYLWRDASDDVRQRMAGVDAVLAAHAARRTERGLVDRMPGWGFCDWVPSWNAGWPPGADNGPCALIDLQFVYALDRAAEMHEHIGEAHLAAHWRDVSTQVKRAIVASYWNEGRGLLADDLAQQHYGEHVQCLALLTGLLDGDRRRRMVDGLLHAPDLERATIYFSHYLFAALYLLGEMDYLRSRLDQWTDLPAQGFKTTRESPEPSRSDCHAWGAHPLYHYYASFWGRGPRSPALARSALSPSQARCSGSRHHSRTRAARW